MKAEQLRKNAIMIWGVLTLAIMTFMFLPLVATLDAVGTIGSPEQSETTINVLMLLANLIGASAVFVWHIGLSQKRYIAVAKSVKNPAELESRLSKYWLTVCLVAWALNESVASFGFVIATIKGDLQSVLPYCFVALLLNLYMFPRYSIFLPEPKRATPAGV